MSHVYMLYRPSDIARKLHPQIKIGYSSDPQTRITTMETASPEKFLANTWKVNDSKLTEKFLHMAFDKYRVRGEWFEIPYDDMAIMMNFLCSVSLHCTCKPCKGFFDGFRAKLPQLLEVQNV